MAQHCGDANQVNSNATNTSFCGPSAYAPPAPSPNPGHAGGATALETAARAVAIASSPNAAARAAEAHLLTSCELQFLGLLAEGRTYQQIADAMHVSINTVRDYVRAAYRKLKVNSRTQAVVKYLRSVA